MPPLRYNAFMRHTSTACLLSLSLTQMHEATTFINRCLTWEGNQHQNVHYFVVVYQTPTATVSRECYEFCESDPAHCCLERVETVMTFRKKHNLHFTNPSYNCNNRQLANIQAHDIIQLKYTMSMVVQNKYLYMNQNLLS